MSYSLAVSDKVDAPCFQYRQVSCGNCRLNTICLPLSLHNDDIGQLNQIIKRSKPLQKGEYLFHAGDAFTSIWAIRSGSVKAIVSSNNGNEQVTGFYLPGEVMGLDGLANNVYTNSVVALETTSACEIPFSCLETLSAKLPSLQRYFLQLMSREITQEQNIIHLLTRSNAEARVASFLLSISNRNGRQNLSTSTFLLAMSRVDIGNFLGLTIETVSRTFTRLQKSKVISVDKKEIMINDFTALHQLIKGEDAVPLYLNIVEKNNLRCC
jgi:CRP/FNR family transcriptional regulator, anaerobic regulatory protein